MRYWLRELAGWVLVVLGLCVFYLCFLMLLGHYVLEAGPAVLIGIIIFRGGIHLLKVAVAARVCLHAQREAERPFSGEGPPKGRGATALRPTRSPSAPR